MNFKFFRVVRIIGLVDIELNFAQYNYYVKTNLFALKIECHDKLLILTSGKFSLR